MRIRVESVSPPESKPGKNGNYDVIKVDFFNLDKEEKGSRQFFSFDKSGVYKTMATAQAGEAFDLTMVKDGKYWNATGIAKLAAEALEAPTSPSTGRPATQARSSYETPEERARRQVLIVRQSSLTASLNYLTHTGKDYNPTAVMALAQTFADWVFEVAEVAEPEVE